MDWLLPLCLGLVVGCCVGSTVMGLLLGGSRE